MANDLNRCEFIGRLGKDPETRFTGDGKAVTNISIAVSEQWKDQGGQKQERTTWVPIVAFGKLAEIMGEYLKKGSRIYVAGKFTVRKWQGQDGQDRWSTEVVATDMQMLDGRSENQPDTRPQQPQQNQAQGGGYGPSAPADEFSDDIPFAPLDGRLA